MLNRLGCPSRRKLRSDKVRRPQPAGWGLRGLHALSAGRRRWAWAWAWRQAVLANPKAAGWLAGWSNNCCCRFVATWNASRSW